MASIARPARQYEAVPSKKWMAFCNNDDNDNNDNDNKHNNIITVTTATNNSNDKTNTKQ